MKEKIKNSTGVDQLHFEWNCILSNSPFRLFYGYIVICKSAHSIYTSAFSYHVESTPEYKSRTRRFNDADGGQVPQKHILCERHSWLCVIWTLFFFHAKNIQFFSSHSMSLEKSTDCLIKPTLKCTSFNLYFQLYLCTAKPDIRQ